MYNENTRRQVVVMVATNSVANDITIKATDISRKIFPDSAYFKIANQSSPDHSGKSVNDLNHTLIPPDESSGHNENPADEEMPECNEVDDMDAIVADFYTAAECVNELTQYYSLTRPDTVSSFEGVSDPRLKEIRTSLGAAMLGVAGKIPGSPWA
ncbi:hypothetical protein N7516_008454 [Penicillium verrucosum]|uniref:uncharacterized protein n=1 Tax=Penicillium verrucosum TaxID=60171 RepID=UPI002545958C|nr:uncharacterized protein N7516_008454 [Penicillium verrucosum]KAJ5926681.1 hypothetical protein N7516_008454 [Penicillium verrucosum]